MDRFVRHDGLRLGIIVQARMGSTRLPGKVLRTVRGVTLLERLIQRLSRISWPHSIVVATTASPLDTPVADLARSLGVGVFRGSEDDVLERYQLAAREFGFDAVVRVTADCPLMDPAIVDQVIAAFLVAPESIDYVSNTLVRTYPRGLDVEIVAVKVLEVAAREARAPFDREHVTPFVYRHPDRFKLKSVVNPVDHSSHRWTVDTLDDLRLVQAVIHELEPIDPSFGMNDVVRLLDRRPDIRELNAHVQQKTV